MAAACTACFRTIQHNICTCMYSQGLLTTPGASYSDKIRGDTVTTTTFLLHSSFSLETCCTKAASRCVQTFLNKTPPPSSEYKLASTYQTTRCQNTEDNNTDLLTNSMQQSPSSEANSSLAKQEIPCILRKSNFITAFTRARHLHLFGAK